jgi:hypothetical protein
VLKTSYLRSSLGSFYESKSLLSLDNSWDD